MYRKENTMRRHRHRGRWLCENGDRDEGDAAKSQRTPGATRNWKRQYHL